MRLLIVALVIMITVVAGGTAALIAYQYSRSPAGPPTTPTRTSPPTEPSRKSTDPVSEPNVKKPSKAEELPPRPALSPKSKFTPLDKEGNLFLEVGENGEKRVLFVATVCCEEGILLEVLCCKKQTKEHESILNVDLDARLIHAALLATGAKAGHPVQFVNPETREAEYKPATGDKITVEVYYSWGGKVQSHRAQEWILDENTNKPMAHDWVFAGSRFVKNPDRPNDPDYYCANNGEVIAISNFVDSMLDLPVEIGDKADDLYFRAIEKKIPPYGSKVWVVLSPQEKPVPKK